MNRRKVEASEIFSIPESASLDTMFERYPGSVEASMLDQGGDLYLRVVSSKSDKEMTEEDIQGMIEEWKTHTKEHATNAGFRKAHRGRGPMDPRRFALQLAEVARLNASRYGSPSLLRLAKRLRWVAGQDRGVAAKALARIAQPLEEEARRRDQTGMPELRKPLEPMAPERPELQQEGMQLNPGEAIEQPWDQSWRARESGRFAKEKEIDSELLTFARDFLQDYKSRNSMYDDDLVDQLQDPNIFDAWLKDLDNKGVKPNYDQLDDAWNEAMNEIAEGSGTSLTEELEGGDVAPGSGEELKPVSATRGVVDTGQDYTAPGGDYFNTVINMWENPTMDRYLRTMKDKREGRSRVGRKIEVDDDIAAAVDQALDRFAGDMLPSEISAAHVQEFVEEEFPDVSAAKVFEAIQEISDRGKRHDDDTKERTNQEASRKAKASIHALRGPLTVPLTDEEWTVLKELEDQPRAVPISTIKDRQALKSLLKKGYVESYPGGKIRALGIVSSRSDGFRRYRRVEVGSQGRSELKRYKEISACCNGTGERDGRCCGLCRGSGQTEMNLLDENREKKEKIAAKLGTLLVVSVDAGNPWVSAADRQELSRVTRTRVAKKGAPLVLRHSVELMRLLTENDIPYRTASYRHPRYQNGGLS
jgi:hypothetical protein